MDEKVFFTIECSKCFWIGRRKYPKDYLLNPRLLTKNLRPCPKCGDEVAIRLPFLMKKSATNHEKLYLNYFNPQAIFSRKS